MTSNSHSMEEISDAIQEGKEVYELDTNCSGEDDILIGSYDEVLSDVLNFYELEALPKNWELVKINSLEDLI